MSDTYQASNVSPADIAAARAAVSGDPLAARGGSGDTLSGDFNQVIQQQRQGIQDYGKLMQDRQRAMAPLVAQAGQMARQPLPQPPAQQQLPAAPQRNQPGEDEQWLMAAMVLGVIGGAFTRQHVTNGLAAMTGALEGYQAGSKEKFEQNLKQWKAESERAKEANDAANTRYKQILESKKLAWDQKMQEIQLAAAQYKDMAAMQLVENGQGEKLGDMMLRRDEATAKMEQTKLQMERDFRKMQETERHNRAMEAARVQAAEVRRGAMGGRDDATIDMLAELGMVNPSAIRQSMSVRDPDLPRVQQRFVEKAKEAGLSAKEITDKQLQFTGEQSYQRTTGTMGGRIEAAVGEVEQVAPLAVQASRNLPRGQFVPLNRIVQMGQEAISDPQYNDFLVKNQSLARAYGRAMNPQGVPRVSEAQEARAIGLLSMANSRQAYEVQVNALLQEIEASRRAITQARKGIPAPPATSAIPSAGGASPEAPAAAPNDLLGRIKSKLPQGWSVEPVQ